MFESILKTVRGEKKEANTNSAREKSDYTKNKDQLEQKINEKSEENKSIRILVVGVGGGGSNCVTRLKKSGIKSAITAAINTDAKHLSQMTMADEKILIGKALTRGLGSGGDPKIGQAAAEADQKKLAKLVEGYDIVFITFGAGGGTGSGASKVVAKLAKEDGAVVIGIATYPFALERGRLKIAQKAITELLNYADSVIVIDNNRLTTFAPNLRLDEAFELVDSVAGRAIRGIADTIMFPSLLNIDYADVRSIMKNGGVSMISLGEGSGVNMVEDAIESTLKHPLLDVSYEGAKGALIHIEGTRELTLGNAIKIAEGISEKFDPDSEVKFGARINPEMSSGVRVTAIVTGVKSPYILTKKNAAESKLKTNQKEEQMNAKNTNTNEIYDIMGRV